MSEGNSFGVLSEIEAPPMFQSSSGQERTSTRRRELLMGGFAGAVGCAFPLVSHAATALVLPTAAADRRFSVKYKGIRIGTHAVYIRRQPVRRGSRPRSISRSRSLS